MSAAVDAANSEMTAALAKLRGGRVLCVGDAMLDRYVHGAVDRISPEAPIPVLRIAAETAVPGGAGNVVRNLVALGVKPVFASVIGDDQAGSELTRLLGADTQTETWLLRERGRTTTIKTRYVSGGQQLLRTDHETAGALTEATRIDLIDRVRDALAECHVLVLSDYGKGVLADGIAEALIDLAREARVPVVVDPKGQDYARYRGADLVTPNRSELAAASGVALDSEADFARAARQLQQAHDIGAVLATRSQDGMTLYAGDAEPLSLPAEAREVFDVSGAGDTVVATMAAGLAAGLKLPLCAALANLAAGIVVGKLGTAVAHGEDLFHALHRRDLDDADRKVVTLAQAQDQIAVWRRHRQRIGFTNGCFDLLHPGHISLVRQAKAKCDRLVIGINSDASVRRLKGDDRPVQNEAARAAVLASLAAVDMVVVFGDDTPLALLEALRPDLLVKGADYKLDEVVGAELVQGYGGEVLLAELAEGHSTSATIARLARG